MKKFYFELPIKSTKNVSLEYVKLRHKMPKFNIALHMQTPAITVKVDSVVCIAVQDNLTNIQVTLVCWNRHRPDETLLIHKYNRCLSSPSINQKTAKTIARSALILSGIN